MKPQKQRCPSYFSSNTGNFGKVSAAAIFVLEMIASVTLNDQR
jgi:hypothetical protein